MRRVLVVAIFLAPLFAKAAPGAASVADEHVTVSLVSKQTALVPGSKAWLGIQLKHEPHWHTYWINPGDSGLPTKLAWSVPDGFHPGEIAWPAPQRFDVGGLFNFGYDGDVLLPVSISVPSSIKPGSTAHLAVSVKWLVCHEECVPGKAALALDLPLAKSTTPDARWARAFASAQTALPQVAAWTGEGRLDGDHIVATLRGANLPQVAKLEVFPVQSHVIAYTPPQAEMRGDVVMLTFAKSDYYTSPPATLDLVLRGADAPAWSISLPFAAATTDQIKPLP